MDFGVIIIILSLLGLIAFAYRGFSVIMMAPIMALYGCLIIGAGHYAFLYGVVYGQGRHLY